MTESPDNRRPLVSRDTGWARSVARWLTAASVSPNQISMASMLMAGLAGAAFWGAGVSEAGRPALLIAAAAFCQLRLLCNLFDGMVAIEGGKKTPDGPFWNEFPDRVADMLILAGAGYGVDQPSLGWAASCFAVLTAYTRELRGTCGLGADFCGPMAKQHRMAMMTAAALLSSCEPLWGGHGQIIVFALWIVAIGAAATSLRRAAKIVGTLRSGSGITSRGDS